MGRGGIPDDTDKNGRLQKGDQPAEQRVSLGEKGEGREQKLHPGLDARTDVRHGG